MLQAAIDESQKTVNGTVRMKLYKGRASVAGRRSENSLYVPDLATFEEDTVYSQADATGFIRLSSLRLKVRNLIERKKG
jgi:argininosuccinate synthase